MRAEDSVSFLNVDLELYGDFDRKLLMQALGESVVVQHEGEPAGNPLVLEVNDEGLDVAETVARFIQLLERLPKKAKKVWETAERRRFDIGIQGGEVPCSRSWTLGPELVAGLAALHAEVAVTVYWVERKTVTARTPKRGCR